MKIVFAGTPEFATVALTALIQSSHEIIAVYTQPDRPAGRGLKLKESPVKQLAKRHHLMVCQPVSLKGEDEQAALRAFHADVMVVAAYGLLLPKAVLSIPRYGCINIHPSLLPRWRGAAPIQRTIFSGETETGVTIMQMDEGLDTGPMLLQKYYSLSEGETTQTLHDKLATMGAEALLETLALLESGKASSVKQDSSRVTYAQKITKEEARIDWSKPASKLDCMIRAFYPWPVAYAIWQDQPIRIGKAMVSDIQTGVFPGTILRASEVGIDVATGDGALTLQKLQLPGGKMLPVAEFYRSRQEQFAPGKCFA